MKKLVCVLLGLLSMSAFGGAVYDENDAATTNIKNMQPMTCFNYQYPITAKHAWEKTYIDVSPYWVLLRKDDKGFLVAQPQPRCEEDAHGSIVCPFWIRSVEYKDNWLMGTHMKIVPCPKRFTESYFRKIVREHYSDEFDF